MPLTDIEARKHYKAEWYRKNRERLLKEAAQYRAVNAERIAATKGRLYHERYKHDPEYKRRASENQKKRRAENREHVKEIERRSREKHKEQLQAYQAKKYGTYETRARGAVNRAVRYGKLPRASSLPCAECGGPAREYHHHKGYHPDNWYDVIPVCAQCHKDLHAT